MTLLFAYKNNNIAIALLLLIVVAEDM